MHALWHRFTGTRIFSEGKEPEVNCSSFTNTWPILISNGSITIYVPRAFQRATPRPLILQHVSLVLKLGHLRVNNLLKVCFFLIVGESEDVGRCVGKLLERR